MQLHKSITEHCLNASIKQIYNHRFSGADRMTLYRISCPARVNIPHRKAALRYMSGKRPPKEGGLNVLVPRAGSLSLESGRAGKLWDSRNPLSRIDEASPRLPLVCDKNRISSDASWQAAGGCEQEGSWGGVACRVSPRGRAGGCRPQ